MRIVVVDNGERSMVSVLCRSLAACEDARVAVAFVSRGGLAMIRPALESAINTGARAEALVGLDGSVTEPEALLVLYEIARHNQGVAFFCYCCLDRTAMYHPKLYILRSGETVTSIIGSSNLTQGGLQRNVEVNVVIEGDMADETISDIYGAYNRLKFDPNRVTPDEELLELYAKVFRARSAQRGRLATDGSPSALTVEFEEKARSLARPVPNRRDLVGWLRLVYDVIPEGEFTNQQIYQREEQFRRHYPENRHIEDKIRQQLQALRDMGLVEHLATGLWRKLSKNWEDDDSHSE